MLRCRRRLCADCRVCSCSPDCGATLCAPLAAHFWFCIRRFVGRVAPAAPTAFRLLGEPRPAQGACSAS
eukprot:8121694-Alexandrium_andersonii.AAC.1